MRTGTTHSKTVKRSAELSPSKLFPKLRFKEFDGGVEETFFGNHYTFHTTNSLSRDKLNGNKGEVRNIHYGDIHTKFQTHFYLTKEYVPFINEEEDLAKIKEDSYCNVGDLILADASEDYAGIGKSIELIDINNEKLLAGLHTFLARPISESTALGYISCLLKSWKSRKQLMTIAQGTKVLSLSTGRVSKLKINLPTLPEQQKIASFLSAVDQKIQQLTKKKGLLLLYKKGAMQQLLHLAGSGQANVQLRFSAENGNSYPDWENRIVGDVFHFSNGKAHEQSIDPTGDFIVVNSKFVSTEGRVRKQCNTQISPLSKGDIVMVMSDVPNGKALAKCYWIEKENTYTLNQRICCLKAKKYKSEFLIYLIQRNRYYLKFDAGAGQTNLKKEEVLNCPVFMPSSIEEQQKIATYLKGIGNKIEEVIHQINQTKTFKKGLLQQLFI